MNASSHGAAFAGGTASLRRQPRLSRDASVFASGFWLEDSSQPVIPDVEVIAVQPILIQVEASRVQKK